MSREVVQGATDGNGGGAGSAMHLFHCTHMNCDFCATPSTTNCIREVVHGATVGNRGAAGCHAPSCTRHCLPSAAGCCTSSTAMHSYMNCDSPNPSCLCCSTFTCSALCWTAPLPHCCLNMFAARQVLFLFSLSHCDQLPQLTRSRLSNGTPV